MSKHDPEWWAKLRGCPFRQCRQSGKAVTSSEEVRRSAIRVSRIHHSSRYGSIDPPGPAGTLRGAGPLHMEHRLERGLDHRPVTTVALVSFMDVVCAAGQFIARANSRALASAELERRFFLAVRPWLAMAVRKWSAVMARLAG